MIYHKNSKKIVTNFQVVRLHYIAKRITTNTFYWFLNDSERDHQPKTTTTNQKEYFLKNCKKFVD
jgi:hypothetical protein